MKNKTQILFPIIFALVLVACETNDVGHAKKKLVERANSCSQDRFEYDGNRLVGYTQWFGPRLSVVGKCIYKDDQLVRIESTSDNGVTRTVALEYDEKGLLKKETVTIDLESPEYNNHYVEITFFEYDENSKLRSKLKTQDVEFYTPWKTEYEWSLGNIVKVTEGFIDQPGNFVPTEVKTITYDGGRNYTNHNLAFAYAIFAPMEEILSKNNAVTISDDFMYDNLDDAIQITNNFKYDVFGYPTENDIKSIFIIGPYVNKLTYE